MQTVLRPFVPSDRDGVNRVAQAAFAQYERHYQDWPSFNEGIGRMADLSGVAELLVAEISGDIAGAVVHVGPGSPRSAIFPQAWSVIRMLVVAPGYRGHGVGRRLVAACLRAAMRDGAPAIGLHTSPIMASALRMYTRIGFTRDRDLDPIRGVPYARYVLPQERFQAALDQLS